MDIYYKKNKNEALFKDLEFSSLELKNIQNYIPIYNKFFSLSSANSNNINLNHKFHLNKLNNSINYNIIDCEITDICDNKLNVQSFLKFSPLLDPLKYLCGKYDLSMSVLLPNLDISNSCLAKCLDENNSAYVDSFFTYLSSKCLHSFKFTNCLDFYGSFLSIKKNFLYNISDDIDYLNDSEYFHKNNNSLFTINNVDSNLLFSLDTRCNKEKLKISEKSLKHDDIIDTYQDSDDTIDFSYNIIKSSDILNVVPNDILENISDDISFNNIEVDFSSDLSNNLNSLNLIYNNENFNSDNDSVSSDSSYSSNSSNTTISNNNDLQDDLSENNDDLQLQDVNSLDEVSFEKILLDDNNGNASDNDADDESKQDLDNDSDMDEEDSQDLSSYLSEEEIMITINEFPVQLICLEKCENTLDSLMVNDELSEKEWKSALFQIIITLSMYQKCFDFTHNDLHTNNIMYVETKKQFIYYCCENIYYKIPTFGKIYKIIDFGRSIYKFQNKTICSDSFHIKGDASTQYNFGVYFDNKKPEILPNPSFDLCRLACSMFDNFIEEFSEMEQICKNNKIVNLICSWLIDDNGKNILYKVNGEERYPEFKLYKMIARTVHNHIPSKQLLNPLFDEYKISKKKINKNAYVMNIDKIDPFYQ